MEMQDIVTIFGNGFFPIVAYAAMFFYMIKKDEYHKQEMDAVKGALDLNTKALTELKDVINLMHG